MALSKVTKSLPQFVILSVLIMMSLIGVRPVSALETSTQGTCGCNTCLEDISNVSISELSGAQLHQAVAEALEYRGTHDVEQQLKDRGFTPNFNQPTAGIISWDDHGGSHSVLVVILPFKQLNDHVAMIYYMHTLTDVDRQAAMGYIINRQTNEVETIYDPLDYQCLATCLAAFCVTHWEYCYVLCGASCGACLSGLIWMCVACAVCIGLPAAYCLIWCGFT